MSHKILLLIDSMNSGGAERQMCGLAIGLKLAGCQVRLCTFFAQDFYADDLNRAGIGVEHHCEGQSMRRRPRVIADIVTDWHPDLVIAYKRGPAVAACIAKRWIRDFRLVVSERNTTQELTLGERIKFFAYRWADVVVPNSYTQARYIKEHFPKLASKTKVITNMVDTAKFHPATGKTGNHTLNIVTVARVMRQKNALNYLEALHLLKEEKLELHCDWYGTTVGEPDYWEEVKAKVAALELEDYITFHDASPNIDEIYRQADIFCLPSLYEGFPNTLVEAMASGLPVACSNVCDNPDIVEDGRNGMLFNPKDASDIARQLKALAQLPPDERKKMGLANRDKACRLCAPDAFVRKYLECISTNA